MADTQAKTVSFSVDVKDMLEAGCHFGHQAQRWSPKIKPYIYTEKNGVHIFDLFKTAAKLEEACQAVYALAKEGKNVVFVGTKRQAQDIVREEAIAAGAPYIVVRWLGGTLTNWEQIKRSLDKMKKLKKDREEGKLDIFTKKERVLIDKDIARLERFFGGIESLNAAPDALFIVDIGKEDGVVKEAVMKDVPVVGIVDSNCDPTKVKYPIPANDDAVRSIKLLVHAVANAYKEGRMACQK
ncbi:MAG: 30S ribosomal protein S2 [Candidatus Pacebacteria bacterium]|nr:30S ribosomal protein S2 [Candidatus Paceibacterota bacterium]